MRTANFFDPSYIALSLVELFGPKNLTGAAFSVAQAYDEPTCSRPPPAAPSRRSVARHYPASPLSGRTSRGCW